MARRYAIGVGLVQLGWVVRLGFGGPLGAAMFVILGLMELAIPAWAERAGRQTPWHPGHIAERYGLFTIIVLGECILAATTAVEAAFAFGGLTLPLLSVALGGLFLVFGLWWSYFKHPSRVDHDLSFGAQLGWGYGHYVVFAALAALGAGLQIAVDTTQDGAQLGSAVAALTVAVPVIVYLGAAGAIHRARVSWSDWIPFGIVTVAILATAVAATWIAVPMAVLATGLIVAVYVAFNVVRMGRTSSAGH